jgi:NAD(P)-dependent dehydrogenase (short-subunit alcohol dehydrogenase family)
MSRFDDCNVVVTGGARGIGRAIVEAFLDEKATVFAIDILTDELERMQAAQKSPDRVRIRTSDLGDFGEAKAAVAEAIDALGRVHVLVNCAALLPSGPFLEISQEMFDRTFAVNTRAAMATMQAIAPHMIEHSGGAIVNIASANVFKNESPEAVYNASKSALVALTRAVAHELGHLGIRANCVAPGQTITLEKDARAHGNSEQKRIQREYLHRIPMRRAGSPAEQAAAVLFLASNDASFVNGETLIVDGGEVGGGDWYDLALAPPLLDD